METIFDTYPWLISQQGLVCKISNWLIFCCSFEIKNFRIRGLLHLKQSEDGKSILIDRIENPWFELPAIEVCMLRVKKVFSGFLNSQLLFKLTLSWATHIRYSQILIIVKACSLDQSSLSLPKTESTFSWRELTLLTPHCLWKEIHSVKLLLETN